jgi:hypothetical protein
VGRLAENVGVILLIQMRRQQPHGAEVDAAIYEERQYQRKPPRSASRFDTVVRGVLGEMQDLGAVREHGGAPLPEVEATRIELRQRGDQTRSRLAFAAGETFHFSDQLVVREAVRSEE